MFPGKLQMDVPGHGTLIYLKSVYCHWILGSGWRNTQSDWCT